MQECRITHRRNDFASIYTSINQSSRINVDYKDRSSLWSTTVIHSTSSLISRIKISVNDTGSLAILFVHLVSQPSGTKHYLMCSLHPKRALSAEMNLLSGQI